MKNGELYLLKKALVKLKETAIETKYFYAVLKNLKKVESEIELLEEMKKPTKEYNDTFDRERQVLCIEYGKKDEKGELILLKKDDQQIVDIVDQVGFDKKIAELQEKYKEVLRVNSERTLGFLKCLNEESKLDLFKIKVENLPKDLPVDSPNNLSKQELESLNDLIEL